MESREEWERWYASPNPWGNEGSLEDRVRIGTLSARLERARFQLALDLGCGEGVMSHALSRRAERTMGFDISQRAIERAQARFPDVEFGQGEIREVARRPDIVRLPFDFVCAAEVLYYLQRDEDRLDAVQAISGLGAPHCLFFFSVIVRGDSKYRRYFTLDSFLELIDPYFNVIDSFPFVALRPMWLDGMLRILPADIGVRVLRRWTQTRTVESCKHVGFFALKRQAAGSSTRRLHEGAASHGERRVEAPLPLSRLGGGEGSLTPAPGPSATRRTPRAAGPSPFPRA
jgi:SAM-dependent methyltransferase